MRKILANISILAILVVFSVIFSGCTLIFQKGRRVDVDKISKLKSELTDLERARNELASKLKQEVDDKEVKIEMLEKGLTITFVAEVLFDSGKADLRQENMGKLGKVSSVLNTTVKDLNVGIEGHTDDVPIKHSGWKSNWELSTARALSVLHYLADVEKVQEKRLSATGFGEHHPVASNSTKEGRAKNRRVEIVILPKTSKEGR